MRVVCTRIPGGPDKEAEFVELETDDGESVGPASGAVWEELGGLAYLSVPTDPKVTAEVERLTEERDAEKARADAAEALIQNYYGRRFPILDAGMSIPWHAIAPYEQQAKINHGQTLEHLARRGGLDPVEAMYVMRGVKLNHKAICDMPGLQDEALAMLRDINNRNVQVVAERDTMQSLATQNERERDKAVEEAERLREKEGVLRAALQDIVGTHTADQFWYRGRAMDALGEAYKTENPKKLSSFPAPLPLLKDSDPEVFRLLSDVTSRCRGGQYLNAMFPAADLVSLLLRKHSQTLEGTADKKEGSTEGDLDAWAGMHGA